MYLKQLELNGFKSFAKKTILHFDAPITAIVGPNGSGKSNVAEAFRWALGEQSMKSLRGKKGEDLIFNGSRSLSRLNRGNVTLVFDNSKKQFPVDFGDVIITREVYRDGVNQYFINKSQVRLKDVVELLSSVSLGASSHHIIHQNESDRILLSSIKDRKSMIEDALGLRVYHWKIAESERKLERTRNNIKEAGSLRREISGHLRFLKKETEKIEKTQSLKKELYELYKKYLHDEKAAILMEKGSIEKERKLPEEILRDLNRTLESLEIGREKTKGEERLPELESTEVSLGSIRSRKGELSRNMGRLEGIIEVSRKEVEYKKDTEESRTFSYKEVSYLTSEIEQLLDEAESIEDLPSIKDILLKTRELIREFNTNSAVSEKDGKYEDIKAELKKLKEEKSNLEVELGNLNKKEEDLLRKREQIKKDIEEDTRSLMEKEREYFETKEKRAQTSVLLETIKGKESNLTIREDEFEQEIRELHILFKEEETEKLKTLANSVTGEEGTDIDDIEQAKKRKEVERLKIRIEEVGPASDEVVDEYEKLKERDEFLDTEITDLQKGEKSLVGVIKELEDKLEEEFKKGTEKINREFQKFFEVMFGGGKASLEVVKISKPIKDEESGVPREEEEEEEGIDIAVSLPRKKIRGLEMLSGGERALTSIALLFAMTQVKPPPFLVLDETDAALDEANSKKYADMLVSLSKQTQLILITHNRETMSRAGILYGVTMGGDGVSRLLSVKFEEAVKIAK